MAKHLSASRRLALGALVAAWLPSGCSPERLDSIRLANLLPLTYPVVATDRLLGVPGWHVRGTEARFDFSVALRDSLLLRMEVRPYPSAEESEQSMVVSLNGQPLAPVTLRPRWSMVELRLPGELLKSGANTLRLEFGHAVPTRSGANTGRSAARFRSLELVSALGRPRSDEVQRRVRVIEEEGSQVVEMPADSLVELAVFVGKGSRLRGQIEVRAASAADTGRLTGSVEMVADGDDRTQSVTLLRSSLWNADEPQNVDLDLARWSGQRVLVRLLSSGGRNGVIRWRDVRIEQAPAAVTEDPLRDLAPRHAPSSGILGRPDVVLVVLDAARADAISAYGASRPTPHLDALAEQGSVMASASSPAPWTAPAVASLLSGLLPEAHSVLGWATPLAVSTPTLAQLLAAEGYHTVLWSPHVVWRSNPSLRRGFEDVVAVEHMQRQRLPAAAELFVEDRPSFALVHLLVPHAPYDPPATDRGRYSGTGEAYDVSPPALRRYGRGKHRDKNMPSQDFVRYARARYDENVAWADRQVGELVVRLRRAGRFDSSLVIVVGDHGEGFFEHGRFLHTRDLYNEMIAIPMIFKWARGTIGANAHPRGPASLVDLAPTLLDAIGAPPGPLFQGRSLVPELLSGQSRSTRPQYSHTGATHDASDTGRSRAALTYDGYKLIIGGTFGAIELYDVAADPGETTDLSGADPVRTQWMLQLLLRQQRRNEQLAILHDSDTASSLTPTQIAALRALGYVQ